MTSPSSHPFSPSPQQDSSACFVLQINKNQGRLPERRLNYQLPPQSTWLPEGRNQVAPALAKWGHSPGHPAPFPRPAHSLERTGILQRELSTFTGAPLQACLGKTLAVPSCCLESGPWLLASTPPRARSILQFA